MLTVEFLKVVTKVEWNGFIIIQDHRPIEMVKMNENEGLALLEPPKLHRVSDCYSRLTRQCATQVHIDRRLPTNNHKNKAIPQPHSYLVHHKALFGASELIW